MRPTPPSIPHSISRHAYAELRAFCPLDGAAEALLMRAMERLGLSARAYDRILKVARTIADLEGAAQIGAQHLLEAVTYRLAEW